MLGRSWVGAFAILAWFGAVASAAPRSALDKPAFSATPAELLAAGKAAAAGDWPVVILRDEVDTSYDEASRATVRWRWVFVVRTQAGVDEWGTLRSQWRPFYQDKPRVRARVIDPGGGVAELDPALVTDAAASAAASNVLAAMPGK